MEETIGYIKCCAAPHFHRESVLQDIRRTFGDTVHIMAADSCGQQGLMSVAQSRICDQ